MEPHLGWLPGQEALEMNPEGNSGVGPAASHHSPLDIQACLLHTVPCPTQPLRFSFSLRKKKTRKEKPVFGPGGELCPVL